MTSDFDPISAEAKRGLERELDDLRAEHRQIAATLQSPGEAGDTADQADRMQRTMRLELVDARIEEITARLRGAATAGPPRTDVIGVGATVTVRFADGTVQTVHVGELAEALDPTLVTADSPLGRALLGHRAGDTVGYDTPEGPETAEVLSLGAADRAEQAP